MDFNVNVDAKVSGLKEVEKLDKAVGSLKSKGDVAIDITTNIDNDLKNLMSGSFAKSFQNVGRQIGQNLSRSISAGMKYSTGKNVFDPEKIWSTKELKNNSMAYMSKVSKTISGQMGEIQKMANAKGWKDYKVTGHEFANGYISDLKLMVTETNGAVKELNFARGKIEGQNRNRNGLIQTDNVKVLKTAQQAQADAILKQRKALDKQESEEEKRVDNDALRRQSERIAKEIETEKNYQKERTRLQEEGRKQSERISQQRLKEEQSVDDFWNKALDKQESEVHKYSSKFNTNSYSSTLKQMQSAFDDISKYEIKDGVTQVESIKQAKIALEDYKSTFDSLQQHFSGKNILDNTTLLSTFDKLETSASKFKNLMSEAKIDAQPFVQLDDALNKFNVSSKSLETLKEKLGSSQFQSKYGNTTIYKQMELAIHSAEDAQSRLNAELDKGKTANFDSINSDLKEMSTQAQKAATLMGRLEQPISELEAATASNKTLSWLNENSKAAKKYGNELKELADLQKNASNWGELDNYKKQFNNITSQAKTEGLIGKSWLDEGKRAFSQIAEFTGMYAIAQNLMQDVPRQMVQAVLDVDTAMTELRKVSDESEQQINQYFEQATKSAKKYGTTIDEVISSTADWKRLGYSLDEASVLSDATTLLQKVGDNMTQESSSEGLISILKGFNKQADEVNGVIDVINQVANTEPIDTAGIVAALQRSASSLSASGNDLNESVAMITAANSVLQDPDSVGMSVPTLKIAISVKLLGRKRPRKDHNIYNNLLRTKQGVLKIA